MNKFPAAIPQKLKDFGLLKPLSQEARQWVDEEQTPIHKLTWKLTNPTIPKGSVLDYLIRSEL